MQAEAGIQRSLTAPYTHTDTHSDSQIWVTRLSAPLGSVAAGCPEGNQFLPQSEAAHCWGGGEHEWIRVPQVQGEAGEAGGAGSPRILPPGPPLISPSFDLPHRRSLRSSHPRRGALRPCARP